MEKARENDRNDFTKGSMSRNIIRLAMPLTVALLINLLYSIVDRMYIGHTEPDGRLALTGIGLAFPLICVISAFQQLCSSGGAPMCAIARGALDDHEAERIMGNSFFMLLTSSVLLTVSGYIVKEPLLYLIGATDATFPFANDYLDIYLLGKPFVLLGLGMNAFISAQGFGRVAMVTVLLGAIINLGLDPILIFSCKMGVRGAALATVVAQAISAFWSIAFLCGRRTLLRLRPSMIKPDFHLIGQIAGLGLSGFTAAITNSAVAMVYNAALQSWGGDLYVGVMTVLNSIRELIHTPVSGLVSGAQPVISYNYGAKQYARTFQGIRLVTFYCIGITTLIWAFIMLFPHALVMIFSRDALLVDAAVPSMRIFYCLFFMMSLQMTGQSVFVALGKSKHAVFFSLLRKVVLVIPAALLLPGAFGVYGVLMAEPLSDLLGGVACYTSMYLSVGRKLKKDAAV